MEVPKNGILRFVHLANAVKGLLAFAAEKLVSRSL